MTSAPCKAMTSLIDDRYHSPRWCAATFGYRAVLAWPLTFHIDLSQMHSGELLLQLLTTVYARYKPEGGNIRNEVCDREDTSESSQPVRSAHTSSRVNSHAAPVLQKVVRQANERLETCAAV